MLGGTGLRLSPAEGLDWEADGVRGGVVLLGCCVVDAAGVGGPLRVLVWGAGVAQDAIGLACEVGVERLEP